MSSVGLAIALVAVFVGACAQGSLGFGLGVIGAPVLALVDASLIPGPLLAVALVLTAMVAFRERGALAWGDVGWAMVGRVPGSILGTFAVVLLPERSLSILFAVLVLAGVALSAGGLTVRPSDPALFTAGAASGLMGSITAIGAPPMALIYQREKGPKLRSTLATFFLFGATLSLTLLVVAGEFGRSDLRHAALLLPAVLAGFGVSRFVTPWLDKGYTRPAILIFSASMSAFLLVSELL